MPNRLKTPRKTENGVKIQIPYGTPKELHRYFRSIVKELEDLGLANSSDSSIVLSLATQMYRRDKLTKEILKEGETFKDQLGAIRINPASKLLNDTISSILRLSMNLGLDPKSRLLILGESNREEEPADIKSMLSKLAG